MLLNVLRAFFVLVVVSVAMNLAEYIYDVMSAQTILLVAIGIASLVIFTDVFVPQKSLLGISGLFFGLLVGMIVAYGASVVLDLFVEAYRSSLLHTLNIAREDLTQLVGTTKVLIGVICCYLAVSFILQTKDDIRFVIPYVEFTKHRKGQHPLILDTSVIIDGRITDIVEAWAIDAPIVIPRFVLRELQGIADSNDKLKRNRGRRGLDVVNKLQRIESIEVQFQDAQLPRGEESETVDLRLVALARKVNGRLVTNDYNLNKLAQTQGVHVININDLSNALKPVFLPGESMQIKVIKPGEEPGQGVGYLEDGTMVVVEAGRDRIGQTLPIMVTSVLQTSAGRMVFGRVEGTPPPDHPRRRSGGVSI